MAMKQAFASVQTETGRKLAAFGQFKASSATRPLVQTLRHPIFFSRQKHYEELQSKIEKAELAGAYATIVAMGHEIGNALGTVTGYCQLMPFSFKAGKWDQTSRQIMGAQSGIERTLGAINDFQTILSKMQHLPKIPYPGGKSLLMVDLGAARKEAVLSSGHAAQSDLERTIQAAEMDGARTAVATFLYGAQEDLYCIRGDLAALAVFSEEQMPGAALKLLTEMNPYLDRAVKSLGDLRIVVSSAKSLSFIALPNGSRLIDLSGAEKLHAAERMAREEAAAAAKAEKATSTPQPRQKTQEQA
ncbi:MAG: hypothetical protein QW568_03630 [Candidatus Anstonellaceae archaeon]